MLYIIGTDREKGIVKTASEKEIIENALYQESQGIEPLYSFYDCKKKERITPKGWLVWSSWNHGCGVVYRRNDGKMIIVTGVQGDFVFG